MSQWIPGLYCSQWSCPWLLYGLCDILWVIFSPVCRPVAGSRARQKNCRGKNPQRNILMQWRTDVVWQDGVLCNLQCAFLLVTSPSYSCQCSIQMIVYVIIYLDDSDVAWGRPLGFIWEWKLLHMARDSLSRSLALQVCNKAEVMLIILNSLLKQPWECWLSRCPGNSAFFDSLWRVKRKGVKAENVMLHSIFLQVPY